MGMNLTASQERILMAAVERIVPPGVGVEAWREGMGKKVLEILEKEGGERAEMVRQGLAAMEEESYAVFGAAFMDMHGDQQDELLERVQEGNVRTRWECGPGEFVSMLVVVTGEAYGVGS